MPRHSYSSPLKPPWWFCRGWWSPWCVIDMALHELHLESRWVCDKHDRMAGRDNP